MRKCITLIILVITLAWGFPIPNLLAQDAALDLTLQKYFTALKEGDTKALRTLLSGDLLLRRKTLLNNPRYSTFLKRHYSNAEFNVVGFTSLDSNRIAVDIEVLSGGQPSLVTTITFIKTGTSWKLLEEKK